MALNLFIFYITHLKTEKRKGKLKSRNLNLQTNLQGDQKKTVLGPAG